MCVHHRSDDMFRCVSDGDDGSDRSDDPNNRDYSRYEGYWHGFTFIIFDSEDPDSAWIRSTYWVPIAGSAGDRGTEHGDQDG